MWTPHRRHYKRGKCSWWHNNITQSTVILISSSVKTFFNSGNIFHENPEINRFASMACSGKTLIKIIEHNLIYRWLYVMFDDEHLMNCTKHDQAVHVFYGTCAIWIDSHISSLGAEGMIEYIQYQTPWLLNSLRPTDTYMRRQFNNHWFR